VGRRGDELSVPVLTPEHPRDREFQDALRELAPDCCPVVAYGALLPAAVLEIPRHGWVNLHFSALPRWRGAAPVQHSIWAGDEVTGATTFRIVRELDAGPVYGVMTERIRLTDTAGDLLARLAEGGAGLLVATLDGIEDGSLEARPQAPDGVSLAPKITVEDARLDWRLPAAALDRQVRACTPFPGAWTTWHGERVKLGPVRPDGGAPLAPGRLEVTKNAVRVGTGTDPVLLGDVQPHGRRRMPAADWARGLRVDADAAFGDG
jgi:methionyl-tRNA formyltransferase